MRKLFSVSFGFILLIGLGNINNVIGQSFTKQYTSDPLNYMYRRALPTIDSGFITCWNYHDTIYPYSSHMFIMKADVDGDTLWTTIISTGDSGNCETRDILIVNDTNYLVTGSWRYNHPGNQIEGIPLVKIGKDGNILWNKFLIQTDSASIIGSNRANRIIEAIDGGNIICTGDNDTCNCKGYTTLIKVDTTGQVEWTNSFIDLGNGDIISTSDSCYLLHGYYGTADSTVILKCDINGDVLWRKKFYRGLNNDLIQCGGMVKNDKGGAFVSMFNCIFNLDTNGDTMWTKFLSTSTYFLHENMIESIDKKLILCGGRPSSFLSYGLLKIDTTGQFIWCNTVSNANFIPHFVNQTADNRFLISLSNMYDPIFIKNDSSLNSICITADPLFDSIPEYFTGQILNYPVTLQFGKTVNMYNPQTWSISHGCQVIDLCSSVPVNELSKSTFNIYPNPSSGIIHLTFENSISKIFIYNIFGERIFERSYAQDFNLSSFPKGIYFLKARFVDGDNQILRIVLQ
jgi:hypothetical protein